MGWKRGIEDSVETVGKGSSSSEAEGKRVGLGKHPESGEALAGWSKVGGGTGGVQMGPLSGLSVRMEDVGKSEEGRGADRILVSWVAAVP